MNVRTAYDRVRTSIDLSGPTRTKQSMKAECDINNIMRKFAKTGNISHFAKHAGYYDYAPAVDYMEALDIIEKSQAMFDGLPAKTRKEFGNDAGQFLAFVQDPKNLERMRELGLANPAPTPETPPPKGTEPAPPGKG